MGDKVTISSVCWIPRGRCAQFPTSCVLEEQDVAEALKQHQLQSSSCTDTYKEERGRHQQQLGGRAKREDGEKGGDTSEANVMEDEDDDSDSDSGVIEGVFGVFASDGAAVLSDIVQMHEADEAEDEEANIILNTDLVLVAATAERDMSSLEIYVHDVQRGSLYVHHDILCGGFPMCIELLERMPRESKRNLVAVGNFDPQIQIWDLDVLDSLEPVHTLGLQQQGETKPKSRRRAPQRTADAHEGPVMCLHVSPMKREALASGSADETAKVWDLTTGNCLYTYKHHSDKVQVVQWHASEIPLLLTASYDRTAQLLDVRQPKLAVSASLGADAEACCWNLENPATCFVSAEDGSVQCIDLRRASQESRRQEVSSARIWGIEAHASATTALQQQQAIPGLLVTCGLDETARIWDLRRTDSVTQGPLLIHERQLKVGPLFTCQASEEKGVFAFGGSQVVIWDLGDTEHVAKGFNL